MDYRKIFFEFWIPTIFIINSIKACITLDILTLLTCFTIAVILQIYPEKKERKSLRNNSVQVPKTKSKKHTYTQTSSNNTDFTGTQTSNIGKHINIKIEAQTQTHSYHTSIGSQTIHYTRENQTQTELKNGNTDKFQIQNIPAIPVNNYTEDKEPKITSTQELTAEEISENKCQIINSSFDTGSTNTAYEEDIYFTLSSLSVRSSSSSEPMQRKKKNGWSRFKKAIKNITHPRKYLKHFK